MVTAAVAQSSPVTAVVKRSNLITANAAASSQPLMTAVIERPNLIVANAVQLTTTQSSPTLTLRNNITQLNPIYVHSLMDVIESSPVDGSTLVYNAALDKYEVKEITITITDSDLDGGVF